MTTPSKSTAKPRVSSKPRVIAKPEVATPVSAKKTSISPAPAKAVQAVKAAKPSKTAAPKTDKKAKPEKVKVVRDSFTIPKTEYAAIAELKKRAMTLGSEAKKSELIRAGLCS